MFMNLVMCLGGYRNNNLCKHEKHDGDEKCKSASWIYLKVKTEALLML